MADQLRCVTYLIRIHQPPWSLARCKTPSTSSVGNYASVCNIHHHCFQLADSGLPRRSLSLARPRPGALARRRHQTSRMVRILRIFSAGKHLLRLLANADWTVAGIRLRRVLLRYWPTLSHGCLDRRHPLWRAKATASRHIGRFWRRAFRDASRTLWHEPGAGTRKSS